MRPLVVAPPRAFLPVVAAASALLAALAGASPTGLEVLDVLATAILGAAMVLAASRAGDATCALTGALAVVCSGGWSEGAVAAGGAFGLAAAVLASGDREAAPALRALAGAGLAQAALRLAWPDPTGASALAATLVMAPVLVAGLRRAPTHIRRTAGQAAGAFVLFAMVASVLAVMAALTARTAVDDGVRAARAGLAAVEQADRPAAAGSFGVAATAFGKADGSIGAWWARPALAVPIVGQHVKALRTLTRAGADLASVGARAAREADLDALKLTNGAFDLDALVAVRAPVEAAMASLDRSRSALRDARSPWLVEPVAERVDELGSRVRSASASTKTAVLALRNAPALLGANGPRRYFLAVQTPAEARASGGLMGNFGELVVDNGHISLGRFGRTQELNTGGAGAGRKLTGPSEYLRRYAPYKPHVYWQSVTMSPDFPTVASVIGELYPQSGGTEVDGVLSVDPFALAALLKLVGPVPVEGRAEPLTADNAVPVLLHEQYVALAEPDRVDFLGTVSRSVFARLTSTTLPSPRSVADTLGPAVAGRHLQLAARRAGEQRFFEHIGAAGAMPPVRGDALGVVTQNFGGNKIDWFLRRAYSYDAQYDPASGTVRSRLQIRLRNDAPAEGLPRSVIGYGGVDQDFTRFGENFLLLSIYSPLAFQRMTVDGSPVTAHEDRELGRRVYSTLLTVPAGSTITVRVDLAGRIAPGRAYRLDVLRQPTVAADEAAFSVDVGRGWRMLSAVGLRPDGVSSAGTVTAVDRTRTFRLHVGRTAGGVVDRLRRGW